MTRRHDTSMPPNAGRSWWLLDALAAEPGEPCPPLSKDTTADVVILGGGYTGMWTALMLKERDPGLDVVVLEQDICGGGPSGRNGGFLNSWWSGLGELCQRLGDEKALALCRAGSESVTSIGRFCSDNDVDAWFMYAGDLGVAGSKSQMGAWDDSVAASKRMGLDLLQELDAGALRKRVDSPMFLGGVFDADAATVQPARLARGLRRVLLEKGVRIHEFTPVTRFGSGSPCVAETPSGVVRAGSAVIALNAWAAAWKRFRRVVMARGSYIVLTEPAPEKLEQINWTGGEGVWDCRASLHYLRTTPDGRIAFGIGGLQPGLAKTIGPRFAYDESAIRLAAQDLWMMFPSFKDVPLAAAWGGPIDVAGHHMPFFGSLGRNVHYGLGFTGNGVGPCHLGGRILSAMTVGADEPELMSLPIVTEEPMRFPPEPFRSPGAMIANGAIRRKDEAEDRGEEPSPLVDFVARLPRRLGFNLGP